MSKFRIIKNKDNEFYVQKRRWFSWETLGVHDSHNDARNQLMIASEIIKDYKITFEAEFDKNGMINSLNNIGDSDE